MAKKMTVVHIIELVADDEMMQEMDWMNKTNEEIRAFEIECQGHHTLLESEGTILVTVEDA